jgi:DMSO/TMAO reductase YedYZ molybdopterin-dependent catalytic subunit
MPDSKEFDDLVAENFASYRLRVGGLVERPQEFSLADIGAMSKQKQITTHFCIQGWSGVAEWGGVPMRDILALVKPTPEARYAVFYSLADGADGGHYYDVPRLRDERQAAQRLARRAVAAALRERARFQDGQVDCGDRVRPRPRRRSGRASA